VRIALNASREVLASGIGRLREVLEEAAGRRSVPAHQ
jgi:hypothetical protein